jgi:outer membrane protein insertion porin family
VEHHQARANRRSRVLYAQDGNDRAHRLTSPNPNCSIDYDGNAHDSTKFDSNPGFKEFFLGNSPKPRLSIGIGVNWVSPFGPLRLDLAKALLKQKGDDTKLFQFNVGTSF